jgi:dTDP-4-dehydrorhamnose reductase
MRILVTGASGLLGLNLALEAAKEHTVIGLVSRHRLKTDAFQTIEGDLLTPGIIETLLERTHPDWVIHCAAMVMLEECEANPALAAQLNTEVPRILATHVARGGARLLHVSTDAVFDGHVGNFTETDPPQPLSVYARTKLSGEQAVAEADQDAIIARVNLFGWSMSGNRSLAEFFFNNLSANKRVPGFTDIYFCPLLANDLAHILIRLLTMKVSGLYHVVSSDCLSKYEFGVRLAEKFGLDASLIAPQSVAGSGFKAARSLNLTLKTDKLARTLGNPPPNVAAGLDHLYGLYQDGFPEKIRRMAAVAENAE